MKQISIYFILFAGAKKLKMEHMSLPDYGLIIPSVFQNMNRDSPVTKMTLLWIYSENMVTRKASNEFAVGGKEKYWESHFHP